VENSSAAVHMNCSWVVNGDVSLSNQSPSTEMSRPIEILKTLHEEACGMSAV